MRELPLVLLGSFAVADIDCGSDIADEPAVVVKTGIAAVGDPAILPVMSPQAIFDCEWPPRIEGRVKNLDAALSVVRVNALRPASAEFLFQAASSEFEPVLVHEVAEHVGTRGPEQNGRAIGHIAKPLFALAQSAL